ncbi:hypothetical protein [Paracoccus cavernae]|uniref:hypothetical protein n=1 Tax=Paracoccus cavernae TaxID=1571207 RepID=UPI00362542A8
MRLFAALAALGKPLVTVVFAGRPLSLAALSKQSDALLYAWHGGVGGPEGWRICSLARPSLRGGSRSRCPAMAPRPP